MSVYVDNIGPCLRSKKWPYREACHLVADSVEELHKFALRMGLRRDWFQCGSNLLPHYDLTKGMRIRAVRLGAIEIGKKELVAMLQRFRLK